jgi:hypothetical protein
MHKTYNSVIGVFEKGIILLKSQIVSHNVAGC